MLEIHSILLMKCISNLYGDKRDRTADPLLARQVLSQLSYIPFFKDFFNYFFVAFAPAKSHTIVYAPVALAKCAAN